MPQGVRKRGSRSAIVDRRTGKTKGKSDSKKKAQASARFAIKGQTIRTLNVRHRYRDSNPGFRPEKIPNLSCCRNLGEIRSARSSWVRLGRGGGEKFGDKSFVGGRGLRERSTAPKGGRSVR
jgi:hypothetical protein